MAMPGFSAQSSLYKSHNHYAGAVIASSERGRATPQMAIVLNPEQLAECRAFCEYCRYTGWGCFACFYCAILISMGVRQVA